MSDDQAADLERLDKVLADTTISPPTRGLLLKRAAIGAAGATAVAGFLSACGGSSKSATTSTKAAATRRPRSPAE